MALVLQWAAAHRDELLEDWDRQRPLFWHVAPRENIVAIESATEGSTQVEAEEEKVKG